MIIKNIKILTFRNIEDISVNFSDSINLIIGSNGSGKTNFLNAIYYVSSGKTMNNLSENDIPMFPEDSFYLSGEFEGKSGEVKIEIVSKNKRKIVSKNGVPLSGIREIMGIVPIVFFNFRTKDILLKEPELRREFMNDFLSIVDNKYKDYLLQYQEILRAKNSILKKMKEKDDFYLSTLLSTLNERMYEKGIYIQEKRSEFLNRLKRKMDERGFIDVSIDYQPKLITPQELNKKRDEEIERGFSLIGPHLDDIFFNIKGLSLKNFFSLGEVEEFTLNLIFSVWEIMREIKGEDPIILLDDIFETMDEEKLKKLPYLLYNLKQVMITSFDERIVPVELKENGSTFLMRRGKLEEVKRST